MWSAIASRTKGGIWVVKKVAIIGTIDIMMFANELIVIADPRFGKPRCVDGAVLFWQREAQCIIVDVVGVDPTSNQRCQDASALRIRDPVVR